jgi:hypothetical protein
MSALTGIFLLIVLLILWRGGEDFRWVGKMTEELGRSIVDFGDMADKALEVRKKIMGTTENLSINKKSLNIELKKEVKEREPQQPAVVKDSK